MVLFHTRPTYAHMGPPDELVCVPLGSTWLNTTHYRPPDATKRKGSHDIMAYINIERTHPY